MTSAPVPQKPELGGARQLQLEPFTGNCTRILLTILVDCSVLKPVYPRGLAWLWERAEKLDQQTPVASSQPSREKLNDATEGSGFLRDMPISFGLCKRTRAGEVCSIRCRSETMLSFDQEITELARALIGARLLVRGVGGTVLETEAYGRDDPASHSFRGPDVRNAAMFGAAGSVYVYLSYGCHLCLNVVGRSGEAVLIRAIRPEVCIGVMRERRGRADLLAAGPGRVGQALGISISDSGKRFGSDDFVLEGGGQEASLLIGPRIGLTRGAERPWRFGMVGTVGLSRPFPIV